VTLLLLIRHGQTDWNREGRYQGQSDIPLNETGRTEARGLAAEVVREGLRPQAIYTSDLARGRETAEILAGVWNVPVLPDARLREIDQGVWEGLRVDEIQARFAAEFQKYREDPRRVGPPEGETVGRVQERVLQAVDEIPMRQRPFEEVLAEVEQQARAERLRSLAKERTDALHQRLSELRGKGFTLEEACMTAGATRVFTEPFSRQEPMKPFGYEPGLAASLFDLGLGGMTPVTETEDGFAIGFLEERLPPDEAAFEQEKESYRQTALQAKQQEQIGSWLSSLRTKANLKSFLEPPTKAQPL